MTERFIPPIESIPNYRNDTLKIIALVTMLIDHIGVIFFPDQLLWRTIGRIAFPIFSWQLVEGFIHTSSLPRYAFRLFLFACISQAPYMFLNPDILMNPLHINIMFQLFSGLLLLTAVRKAESSIRAINEKPFPNIILSFLFILVSVILIIAPDLMNAFEPEFLFSYGTYGQLMFLVFFFFRGSPGRMMLAYMAMSMFHALEMTALWDVHNSYTGMEGVKALAAFWSSPESLGSTALWSLQELPLLSSIFFQARSIITLPLIWIFENRPTRLKLNRWLAYWFYPVHIAILVSIKWILVQG